MRGVFFFLPLFNSSLKVPSDSLFELAVIDGWCALDRGPGLVGQGQDAAFQLFHIDKQGKKCHLQHLEIDAVIHATRKHT